MCRLLKATTSTGEIVALVRMTRMRGNVSSQSIAQAMPKSVNLDVAISWLAERAKLEEYVRGRERYGMWNSSFILRVSMPLLIQAGAAGRIRTAGLNMRG